MQLKSSQMNAVSHQTMSQQALPREPLKLKLHALAFAAVVAVAAQGAAAQAMPETLQDALRKAVDTNPEVQARWQSFLAADAERDAIRGGFKPKIDVQAGVGRERRAAPATNVGTYNFGSASVTLTQMLFDGGFTSSELKRASYAKLVSYYELLDAAENTSLEATRAYLDVLRYREMVELAKANYVVHRQVSDQINERTAAGVGRRVDAEQALGRLALADSNLTTELSNLHDVSARYLRLVGEAPASKLGGIPARFNFTGMPATVKTAVETAYINNPAMNAAVENVEALRAQVEARQSAFKPRLELRLQQGYDRNLDGVNGSANNTSAQVVMNYNLYRGGSDQALELQAQRNVSRALDLQEKVCRDTRQTTMISFNDVRRIQEQLVQLEQHRLSTEKSREAYRQQFDIGQRTLLDLLDTQNEFFEASRAHANARYNLATAEGRTMASLGGLMEATGVRRNNLPTPQEVGQSRQRDLSGICSLPGDLETVVDRNQLMANAPLPPVTKLPAAKPVPPLPNKVTFSAGAFFDFDKSELKPEAQSSLSEFATRVKAEKRDKEVLLAVGHTDSMGTDEYNERLSLVRATAVQAFLMSQGLDAKLIKAEGRGEAEPVADNNTEEGRAKNRRVEISFSK